MEHTYTCATCGCHEFVVVQDFTLVETLITTTPCACGESDDAATHTRTRTTACRRSGELDEEHRFRLNTSVERIGTADKEDEVEVSVPLAPTVRSTTSRRRRRLFPKATTRFCLVRLLRP